MTQRADLQLNWHMLERDLSFPARQIARFIMDVRMGFLATIGAYSEATRIVVKLQDTEFPVVLRYATREAGIAAAQTQLVSVEQTVAAVGRSSFQLRYRLALRGSEQVLALSTCVMVCVSVATGKPAALPEAVRQGLLAARRENRGGGKFALQMQPRGAAGEAFALTVVPLETDEDHNEHVNQSNFIKYLEHAKRSLARRDGAPEALRRLAARDATRCTVEYVSECFAGDACEVQVRAAALPADAPGADVRGALDFHLLRRGGAAAVEPALVCRARMHFGPASSVTGAARL
jgi:acyl-CoA thioesterase FadM